MMLDWECPECKWPERCAGNPFGLDRPRCPWPRCSNFQLLMQWRMELRPILPVSIIKGVT